MKKYVIAFLVTLFLAIGTVIAFGGITHGGFFAGNREEFRQRLFERVSKELNLSEDQRIHAKTILEETKTRIEPLMATLKQNRESAKALGTDGVYDQQKAEELANAQGDTMKRLFLEKEKTKALLFALLDRDQREKTKGMLDKFGGRFGRGGHPGFERNEGQGF